MTNLNAKIFSGWRSPKSVNGPMCSDNAQPVLTRTGLGCFLFVARCDGSLYKLDFGAAQNLCTLICLGHTSQRHAWQEIC